MNATAPTLPVVIPTLGRPILVQTLESISAAAGFESLEVVIAGRIADGPVLDRIVRLCRAHPQVRHLPVSFEHGDSSNKKNAGFRDSRTDIVAFIDDDVVVAKDWPARILEPFRDPAVGLVSGPSLVPEDISLMGRLAGVALASKAAGYVAERYLAGGSGPREVKWSHLIGCNMAYRKTVLADIGEFDPAFWPGEEMIAAFKATSRGHKLVFHPGAWLYHYPRASFTRFWRQIHGYGATRIRLIRAGVEFEPTTMVPGLWLLSLVVLGAAAFVNRWFAALLGAEVGLYLLWDLTIALRKAAETGKAADAFVFFLVPIMHFSYGLGEWVEFFRPGRDLSEGR